MSNKTINKNPLLTSNVKEKLCWSNYLEENFGKIAAWAFALGSDLLLDEIEQDLDELSGEPKDTHLGELPMYDSEVLLMLPEQFVTRYNYEFMNGMKQRILHLQKLAKNNDVMSPECVLDELIFLLCNKEAVVTLEMDKECSKSFTKTEKSYLEEWIFDLFDDCDILTCLYSDLFELDSSHTYHFDNWTKKYCA